MDRCKMFKLIKHYFCLVASLLQKEAEIVSKQPSPLFWFVVVCLFVVCWYVCCWSLICSKSYYCLLLARLLFVVGETHMYLVLLLINNFHKFSWPTSIFFWAMAKVDQAKCASWEKKHIILMGYFPFLHWKRKFTIWCHHTVKNRVLGQNHMVNLGHFLYHTVKIQYGNNVIHLMSINVNFVGNMVKKLKKVTC